MEKRFVIGFLAAIAIVAVVGGCSENTTAPSEHISQVNVNIDALGVWYPVGGKASAPTIDVGELHNRVMQQLNLEFPYPYNPSKSAEEDIVAATKTAVLAEYPEFSSADYDSILARVRPYKVDGQYDMTTILSGPEYDWWNGLMSACSGSQSSSAVRQAVVSYGAENGLPLPGTALGAGVSVLLDSAVFWFDIVKAQEKKNIFSFIMADAAGGVVGWKVGEAVTVLSGHAEAMPIGAGIGALFGSAGYLIG